MRTALRPKSLAQVSENPCEVAGLFHLLGGRWVLPVLFHLHRNARPMRFGELRRAVGEVTTSELTKTLRLLESMGIVSRELFAEVPLRVEYRCTRLGDSLRRPLADLAAWLQTHGAELKSRMSA